MQIFEELPRYRTLEAIAINGLAEPAGRELEYLGWPRQAHAFSPLNESARAIMKHWRDNGSTGVLNDSPVQGDRVMLPSFTLPRWRALVRAEFVTQSPFRNLVPRKELVFARQTFATVSWPDWPDGAAEPASPEAERILAHLRDHPNARRAPIAWDTPFATIMTIQRWDEISASKDGALGFSVPPPARRKERPAYHPFATV